MFPNIPNIVLEKHSNYVALMVLTGTFLRLNIKLEFPREIVEKLHIFVVSCVDIDRAHVNVKLSLFSSSN